MSKFLSEITAEDKMLTRAAKNNIAAKRTMREDIHFLTIALNLSGRRRELEDEAAELVESIGYIRARKLTAAKGGV